jgi:hypothetical protein
MCSYLHKKFFFLQKVGVTGSVGVVGKIGLTHGAHASAVDREKAPRTEGVNQRRKRTSTITPMARVGRAAWAGMWASTCGRGERPVGPAGPMTEWAARSAGPKAKKRISELKNWIFEFSKALEICTRRFMRNFDMRIFPKFF